MITGFARIQIEVPDLATTSQEYAQLLGHFEPGPEHVRLPLQNVSIDLLECPGIVAPRIRGLVLLDSEQDSDELAQLSGDLRKLELHSTGSRTLAPADTLTATGISAVDHIVLMSADADDCIRLFGEDGLGMRLALDQLVPEWGGRMLFFRCGKLTLEVIQRLEDPPEQDAFWGITYFCPDLEATLAQLDIAGVDHSSVREGRKPGTRVATIKSHTLGIPTLLIEPGF